MAALIPKSIWHPAWLKEILEQIHPLDVIFQKKIQDRLDRLTKPPGSLGRLEKLACQYATIRTQERPHIQKKIVYTFAADHGIVEENVSSYPKEVTAQMIYNFLQGKAAVNILAEHVKAEVKIIDIGVDHDFGQLEGLIHKKVLHGTANMSKGPAMTRQQALTAMEEGCLLAKQAVEEQVDLAGTGDMGIGNTTPSSAIAAVLTGKPASAVTGRGAGLDDAGLEHKMNLIDQIIQLHRPDPKDPIGLLAKMGGLEIAAICGFLLGSAAYRLPVVVDGFISTAAAIIAVSLSPPIREHLFISHLSAERGHRAMCGAFGLKPILDMDMRLGEGTGACLGMSLVEAGVKILTDMATFEEARISKKRL